MPCPECFLGKTGAVPAVSSDRDGMEDRSGYRKGIFKDWNTGGRSSSPCGEQPFHTGKKPDGAGG